MLGMCSTWLLPSLLFVISRTPFPLTHWNPQPQTTHLTLETEWGLDPDGSSMHRATRLGLKMHHLSCTVGSHPIKLVVVMSEWCPGNKAQGRGLRVRWREPILCVFLTLSAAEVLMQESGTYSAQLTSGPESRSFPCSQCSDKARFTCIPDIGDQSAAHLESPGRAEHFWENATQFLLVLFHPL